MNFKRAENIFIEIHGKRKDPYIVNKTDRMDRWLLFLDMLLENDAITIKEYDSWDYPRFCCSLNIPRQFYRMENKKELTKLRMNK